MNVALAVVVSALVLVVALVVATTVLVRAVRAAAAARPDHSSETREHDDVAAARLQAVVGEARELASRFERSTSVLAETQRTMAATVSRLTESGASSGSTEVTDTRIFAELNHALQTPLRGLSYAVQNLANLSDDVLLRDREQRLAELTGMLDNCTSTLITFRGLVDRVASIPTWQPSLDQAVRTLGSSIPHPPGGPVTVDFAGLPDRVDNFSNHYLLTMLQPLVENAVEGCVPGGTVEVIFADHGDTVEFTVSNPVDCPVDKEVLFQPGLTTKDGHQGLGIYPL